MSVEGFFELLGTYLQSSFLEFRGYLYRQNEEICIGSCLVLLIDLLLTHLYRRDEENLGGVSVERVFRYVDDYHVLFMAQCKSSESRSRQLFHLFEETLDGLTLTMKLPSEQRSRFLEVEITFVGDPVCCAYSTCSRKALLPFTFGHYKLVKCAIAV
ncbi:hypothetical protein MRX96_016723 [Rhipicephalus microplus]